jgi:hypothetical protein
MLILGGPEYGRLFFLKVVVSHSIHSFFPNFLGAAMKAMIVEIKADHCNDFLNLFF